MKSKELDAISFNTQYCISLYGLLPVQGKKEKKGGEIDSESTC